MNLLPGALFACQHKTLGIDFPFQRSSQGQKSALQATVRQNSEMSPAGEWEDNSVWAPVLGPASRLTCEMQLVQNLSLPSTLRITACSLWGPTTRGPVPRPSSLPPHLTANLTLFLGIFWEVKPQTNWGGQTVLGCCRSHPVGGRYLPAEGETGRGHRAPCVPFLTPLELQAAQTHQSISQKPLLWLLLRDLTQS